MGRTAPGPDTGLTQCYNSSEEITCPELGEVFYGQNASYTIHPPSYTKLDADGNDLADSAVSWVMLRDNVNGLIWEVKTDDGSIHDKDDKFTRQDAQDVFIASLNASSFKGYADRRYLCRKGFITSDRQSLLGSHQRNWWVNVINSGTSKSISRRYKELEISY